jgi:GNAT superfamily N-acetyltransferase
MALQGLEDMRDIREAVEADTPDLLSLSVELHEYSASAVPSRLRVPDHYDEEAQRAYARDVITSESSAYLLALDGGQPVGFAEVRLEDREEDPAVVPTLRGYLQTLIVTSARRGEGIGAELLGAAEDWARARGAQEMELDHWVFPGDPGAFYERADYRSISKMLVKPLT